MTVMGMQPLRCRLRWFYQHPLVFIGILFVISISLIVFNMYSVANALTEKTAEQHAEQYLNALAQARSIYSSEVVARVRDHGIGISQDYRTHEGNIPFPATFSIILIQPDQRQPPGHRHQPVQRLSLAVARRWRPPGRL